MSIRSNRYGTGERKTLSEISRSLWLFVLRFLTSLAIGTTLALVGKELAGYGDFVFTLIIACVIFIILRISKKWKLATVIIFDLLFILFALLLRMYILVVSGA